jgi:hypothetical protein
MSGGKDRLAIFPSRMFVVFLSILGLAEMVVILFQGVDDDESSSEGCAKGSFIVEEKSRRTEHAISFDSWQNY